MASSSSLMWSRTSGVSCSEGGMMTAMRLYTTVTASPGLMPIARQYDAGSDTTFAPSEPPSRITFRLETAGTRAYSDTYIALILPHTNARIFAPQHEYSHNEQVHKIRDTRCLSLLNNISVV